MKSLQHLHEGIHVVDGNEKVGHACVTVSDHGFKVHVGVKMALRILSN